jgi:hypothetical protein
MSGDRVLFKGGTFRMIGTVRGCEPAVMEAAGWPYPYPWMYEVRDTDRRVVAVCSDHETANQVLRGQFTPISEERKIPMSGLQMDSTVTTGPFLISVGGKSLACEQCGVNLFRKQTDNNRMSPRDAPAIRCECNHCGEPCDIAFNPYRTSQIVDVVAPRQTEPTDLRAEISVVAHELRSGECSCTDAAEWLLELDERLRTSNGG